MDKDNKIIYRSYKQSDEANLNSHNMESFVYNGNFRLVECGYAKIDNRWKKVYSDRNATVSLDAGYVPGTGTDSYETGADSDCGPY